ncbi:hypothetical protein NQZ68_016138 [Dissostichus eleginoides]|nr:hypothetical protein NQZ68_016138 [Dissostichus eleginoides]
MMETATQALRVLYPQALLCCQSAVAPECGYQGRLPHRCASNNSFREGAHLLCIVGGRGRSEISAQCLLGWTSPVNLPLIASFFIRKYAVKRQMEIIRIKYLAWGGLGSKHIVTVTVCAYLCEHKEN